MSFSTESGILNGMPVCNNVKLNYYRNEKEPFSPLCSSVTL